jgi:hypothetical protein
MCRRCRFRLLGGHRWFDGVRPSGVLRPGGARRRPQPYVRPAAEAARATAPRATATTSAATADTVTTASCTVRR